MNAENTPEPSADLRWPSFTAGLQVGFFIILLMTIVMVLLQLYYAGADGNAWLVIKPDGFGPFQQSITAVVTTHFFHASWEHLWNNLGGLWIAGLIAFAFAGYQRAFMAIVYGGGLTGLVLLFVGADGATYLGSSAIVFAFMGLIIPAAIRKGIGATVLMVIGFSFIDNLFFDTIRPTAVTAEYGIAWLGHLCGLIGGIMADLNNPTEAVRVLYKKGIIGDRATEALLRNTSPELYVETADDEEELGSASEEILREEETVKKEVEDAIREVEQAERTKKRAKEDVIRGKKSTKDEATRKKQEIKDAKLRAQQLTKDAKRKSKEADKQAKESK